MSLKTTLTASIDANLLKTGDLQSTQALITYAKVSILQTGTGDDQADNAYTVQSTLDGTTGEVVDLSALTNPVGDAIAFTKIKAIMIYGDPDNGDDISFGPNSSEGFADFFGDASDRVRVPPGGVVLLTSPVGGEAVADNTDDKLYVYNNDSSAGTYDLIIVGVATVS